MMQGLSVTVSHVAFPFDSEATPETRHSPHTAYAALFGKRIGAKANVPLFSPDCPSAEPCMDVLVRTRSWGRKVRVGGGMGGWVGWVGTRVCQLIPPPHQASSSE